MLRECRDAHILGDIWNIEVDGDIYLKFDQGKVNVRLNQDKLKSVFFENIHSLSSFASDSKMSFILSTTIRNAENCVLKCRHHHFCLFAIAQH